MLRKDIEEQYKWDLAHMYPNMDRFMEDVEIVETTIEQLVASKDSFYLNEDNFYAFLLNLETKKVKLDALCAFASMINDVESEDSTANKYLAIANALEAKNNTKCGFIPLVCMQHEVEIKTYLQSERCQDFTYQINEILRYAPHHLDEKQEDMLNAMKELMQAPSNTYFSFRLNFKDVEVNGQKEFLNGGNYHKFLLNPDANVRKQAFENYVGEYKNYENVFANLLTTHAKGQILNAQYRHYNSALQASLFDDGVDEQLFNLVLKMGNEKYLDYVHEYFQLRKDVLKMDEQHIYDIYVPMVESVDLKFNVDEGFNILKQALKPLGDDYIAMLDVAREQRWIDFYPHDKKRSGAYSFGTYGNYPYILLNYNESFDSLSTLAHEFGHSMHSYYSDQNNRGMNAAYQIFVAEAASTVNELLLSDYMLKHCEDKKTKAYLIAQLLDTLVGTLYRQTMYAKFEADLHDKLANGEALSSKEISDLFLTLNKNYYGDGVVVDDLQAYQCYAIPHFYYNFYVYKYTLGMSVAIAFSKQILSGNAKDFKYFLTRGGSTSPLQSFIDSNVDPSQEAIFDDAFNYFKELLDELKALLQ